MPDDARNAALENLLNAAFREALKTFSADVERGAIDPVQQADEFQRRRRDYATRLRMQEIPEEARALATHLLQAHDLHLDAAARDAFDIDVTRLLIRLYDAFVGKSESPQGSR